MAFHRSKAHKGPHRRSRRRPCKYTTRFGAFREPCNHRLQPTLTFFPMIRTPHTRNLKVLCSNCFHFNYDFQWEYSVIGHPCEIFNVCVNSSELPLAALPRDGPHSPPYYWGPAALAWPRTRRGCHSWVVPARCSSIGRRGGARRRR